MSKKMESIKAALQTLKVSGRVRVSLYNENCFQVEVNGKWFGLYDVERNTFVE